MPHFILRYRGTGETPDGEMRLIEDDPETTVLDSSSKRMLLVEAEEERIGQLLESLPDWVASPERTVALPDPRPRVLGPPSPPTSATRTVEPQAASTGSKSVGPAGNGAVKAGRPAGGASTTIRSRQSPAKR
jgi:hypothetical protein